MNSVKKYVFILAVLSLTANAQIKQDDNNKPLLINSLQNKISENKNKLSSMKEKAESLKVSFKQKYQEKLLEHISNKHGNKSDEEKQKLSEIVTKYKEALSSNPDSIYAPKNLYNLAVYAYEYDELLYFEKLAQYSKSRDEGKNDVDFPEENFTTTIDALEKLIEYKKFPHLDAAYYLLALSLWYEGVFYEAVDRFKELITLFPKSSFVEEVWFRLGEFFYDMEEYTEAINAYEQVLKNSNSNLFDKAIYKIAWSNFQTNKNKESINYFVRLLKIVERSSPMKEEAIRYIVKNFNEQFALKITKEIQKYFSKNKPPYYRDIFLENAKQLYDQSLINDSISSLNTVVSLDENHPDNPSIDAQIISILQEQGRSLEAREKGYEVLKKYGKNSDWYKAQKDIKSREAAKASIRDAMLTLAVDYHKSAKNFLQRKNILQAKKDFNKAINLYLQYINDYPEKEDIYKAIFYYAEIKFELEEYKEALAAYDMLVNYPLHMEKPFRKDSAFNIVFTFRNVLEDEVKAGRFKEIDFNNLTAKYRGETKEDIPELGKKYLSAIDEFLVSSPEDKRISVFLFHKAAIYYVYGHIEQAYKLLTQLIDRHPKTQAAKVAARLFIDDSIKKEDWQEVIRLANGFAAKGIGGDVKDFDRIEKNAKFKIAKKIFEEASAYKNNNQLKLAKEKYKEAASMFEKLIKESPDSNYADIILFNIAHGIVNYGSMAKALPYYKRLYTNYPKSKLARSARFQEAIILEKMLRFKEAALAYDKLIKLNEKSNEAADALLNKSLLLQAAGEPIKAAASYIEFSKKFPNHTESSAALLTAAQIYKDNGRLTQQISMLQQFIRQAKRSKGNVAEIIEAHVQVGDSFLKLRKSSHNQKSMLQNYRAAVKLYSKDIDSAFASFFAAKAHIKTLEPQFNNFLKMRITGRSSKVQGGQLTAMMKKLTELSKQYEGIIKTYAQPVWNSASLHKIGLLYEHLANSMLNSPCPRDVSSIDDFACEEYAVLLEDKAAVLEEKALDAYKQSYDIAKSSYDAPQDLVTNIQLSLNRINPEDYPKVGSAISKVKKDTFISYEVMLDDQNMAYEESQPNEI